VCVDVRGGERATLAGARFLGPGGWRSSGRLSPRGIDHVAKGIPKMPGIAWVPSPADMQGRDFLRPSVVSADLRRRWTALVNGSCDDFGVLTGPGMGLFQFTMLCCLRRRTKDATGVGSGVSR